MSTIKLLHISDLHISKYPNLLQWKNRPLNPTSPGNRWDAIHNGNYAASHSPGKLKALVSLAYGMRNSLKAILITGDIATTGLDFDLDTALPFIEGPPYPQDVRMTLAGGATISGLGAPIHLLPGNHDRYKLVLKRAGYAPGNRVFHTKFGKYWTNDVKTYEVIEPDFAVAIIAADFSLRSFTDSDPIWPPNWHAQGKIYDDILTTLESETRAFRKKHESDRVVYIIWAVHFPPVYPRIERYMRLLDDDRLVTSANNNCISLIVSGHTHDPLEYSSPRMKFRVLCAGSASQEDCPEGNHCQLISLENVSARVAVNIVHYRLEDGPPPAFVQV